MNVLISGATGLIGTALVEALGAVGHHVGRLVRPGTPLGADDVTWDPAAGQLDPAGLEGRDAFVHLSGENIAKRWTEDVKRAIRDSRVESTRLLCRTLASLARPPAVLACASAIGYYGHRGEEVLTEDSAAGTGFLADVCRDWEAATQPAAEAGIRVVILRFGMVLSPAGGALKEMLKAFRMGLGGRVGDGDQYWSWIDLLDAARSALHALTTDSLRGPVNVTAPRPATNHEFTEALGAILHRPTLLPAPAFALRLALGEMADALLLASTRAEPRKLTQSGFAFERPNLREALEHLLGEEATAGNR
jgi:hypothetical protein